MKRRIALGLLFTGAIAAANAQEGRQLLDKLYLQESSLQSQNAALLQQVETPNIGETAIRYSIADGDFKHPLLPAQSHYFGFSSSRFQELKGWKLYGKFDLQTGTEKSVAHTAQLDPLRLNPYLLMDSLQGDWNKQRYGIAVNVASPFFKDRIAVGLGLKYNVHTGARQRDPRSENTQNALELRPAVAYKLNERHTLGAFGNYQHFVEDLRLSNIDNKASHNLYKLIGLGEYVGSAPFMMTVEMGRRYTGQQFGGGLNYSYQYAGFNSHVEAYYNKHKEEATDGSTHPQNAGEHRYTVYGLQLNLSYTNSFGIHQIQGSWSQKDVDNREFHQYQDPISKDYITLFSEVFNTNLVTDAALGYSFGKQQHGQLSWQARLHAQYSGMDNRYATSQSQQTVDRMYYKVDFDKYLLAADQSGFVLSAGLGYSEAIKTIFHYVEKPYSTNFVAKHILYPTNAFLATDFWQANAAVQYVFKPKADAVTQFYIKASGGYVKPSTSNEYFAKGMSRINGQLAIGVYSF